MSTNDLPSALLRFPGACGVRDFLEGRMTRLAPPDDPTIHFTRASFDFIRQGTGFFGCLLVFRPARFALRPTSDPLVLLGTEAPFDAAHDVAWIPPRLVEGGHGFTRMTAPADVEALAGATLKDEARAMRDALAGYFEEVDAVWEARLDRSPLPWYARPEATRRALLDALGLPGRWTPGR